MHPSPRETTGIAGQVPALGRWHAFFYHFEGSIQSLRVIGVLFQLSYLLRRHLLGGWSLARWLGLGILAAAVAILIDGRAITWQVIALAVLLLAYVALLVWASRRGFVHFQPAEEVRLNVERALSHPPLRPEELVPVRASGWCTVQGSDQYYVNLEAEYESFSSREHAVLARVYPSRFLLLGSWPKYEVGWWYIFFQPAMLRQVQAGLLYFGSRARPALQIVYAPDEESTQTAYLASDPGHLRRIWQDLQRDAPPEVERLGPAAGE